jgi:hypothetical protein
MDAMVGDLSVPRGYRNEGSYNDGFGGPELLGCLGGIGCFLFLGLPAIFSATWGFLHAGGDGESGNALSLVTALIFATAVTVVGSFAVARISRDTHDD